MSWSWRYEAEGGQPLAPSEVADGEPFPSQADAETWLGENWRELQHAGIFQVTLLEDDRIVYGGMGLNPPD